MGIQGAFVMDVQPDELGIATQVNISTVEKGVMISIFKDWDHDGELGYNGSFILTFDQAVSFVDFVASKMMELKPIDQQRAELVELLGEETVTAMDKIIHDSAAAFAKAIEDKDHG